MINLTGEEVLASNRRQIIEQAEFVYSPFRNALEKQTEKQFHAFKSLELPIEKDELKQIEGIFPKNLLNDLIINNLKEIIKLKDIIKTDELCRKVYNFSEYSLPVVF